MRILDLGSGPTPKLISNYTEIEVVSADNRFLEIQDMEKLTYPDNSFDLVVCINALDHTKDAEKAVNEMLRVGLVVYINCAIDQKTRHRKKHYWDAKPDGTFTNGTDTFSLKEYGFEVEFKDGRIKCFLS
jgi:ubiquinone/menaquinone biosynthesis C-methylase UbiE